MGTLHALHLAAAKSRDSPPSPEGLNKMAGVNQVSGAWALNAGTLFFQPSYTLYVLYKGPYFGHTSDPYKQG